MKELQIREMTITRGDIFVLLDVENNVNFLIDKEECNYKLAKYILTFLRSGYTIKYYEND